MYQKAIADGSCDVPIQSPHEPALVRNGRSLLTACLTFVQRQQKASAAPALRERRTPAPPLVYTHLKGHASVRQCHAELVNLADGAGQIDSVEDLSYFLEKPGLMARMPHLILMREGAAKSSANAWQGALLIHEFRPFGIPTGIFATSDRSGRGVLLGRPEDRLRLALRASDMLLRKGAKMVMLTAQCDMEPSLAGWGRSLRGVHWASRNRRQPSHLELASTFEETLSLMGQKTRANLRYYRKRAENELGCRFIPEATLTPEELFALNQDSMFPISRRGLRWRHSVLSKLQSPYLMGLQDRDGQWLSVIAGRRFGQSTEILWQLNRKGLQRHSIVTAMRSFHLEHEIARGTKRFYVEGGTNHSMQHSFQTVPATDVVMIRARLKGIMCNLAKRYVPPDNILAEILSDPQNKWRSS